MKTPWELRDEACLEAYEIFDSKVRSLDRNRDGTINQLSPNLHNNDVDAFRHAYVSGVFTQEYCENVAEVFGLLQELSVVGSPSPQGPGEKNMDLWNNSVGRKYGKKSKSRTELGEKILEALQNSELIVFPEDTRKSGEPEAYHFDPMHPVIVLKEDKSGRNILFADLHKKTVMSRSEFIEAIESNRYPGYRIATRKGVPTPVSRPDSNKGNNLS